MDRKKIKDDEIYWTILSSTEADPDCEGKCQRPYRVKAKISYKGCLTLHRFNEEDGEIDLDTNAYVLIGFYTENVECFLTEKEAQNAYLCYIDENIRRLEREKEQFLKNTAHH